LCTIETLTHVVASIVDGGWVGGAALRGSMGANALVSTCGQPTVVFLSPRGVVLAFD